ncbi:TPA: lytic transglycosylase domain-containing protein [Stenotrophomonas maltophilia]|uniref:Lytic transglycosylase domain-containing protein n=1 Tax=Stenotrophomonas maltophilia TaxID=40324 RepID=A0AAI9C822_STEMA|nr:lytic transglycosylase domain-containing protein [Stenotrophomonas maltophilia]EKT4439791.1 lytic transglycosylase domain-containing protein [Stenotrophomonas maltophilia]MBN5012173.1 lytic transglycosylase domain-containing protein [Stenotrophomonas maltophilia]HDS1085935.1 lytic transglycosylase domain-containing protein [Stenotrophomonas maltophilia]HDS1305159.1 lytic transglycosylase domain-containing protein [Stenotrophomonas maltophilia]HDS1823873.1 lytic transglycosylase domain-conta
MLPGLEMMACPEMAVSMDVMQHVINVESSRNPYAIGVVGGALVRQPKALDEALATVRMLEEKGYNFSIGLAQVNRYNLGKYGLDSYEKAFQQCPNLQAGSRILAECYKRSGGDWGKSFSCYYSGNFETGFRHGYVQKVYDSIRRGQQVASNGVTPIDVISRGERRAVKVEHHPQLASPAQARIVAQSNGPVYVPSDDPARAYVVYPSTGAMARGSLLNIADQALSKVVLGSVDRMMQPQQAGQPGGAAQPQQAQFPQGMAQRLPSQNSLAMPQQLPGAAGGTDNGPVMLRPWSERNLPVAESADSYNAPAQGAPVQQIPAGDAAFVF